MNPEQPGLPPPPPQPQGQYDFIMSDRPQRPSAPMNGKLGKVGNDPFIKKLIVLIGGTLTLIIIGVVVVNILFGNKTNVADLVELSQQQSEIVRVSKIGTITSGSPTVRGAAVNTQLTVTSQQQQIIDYLAKSNHKVGTKELTAKKDLNTDKQLTAATAATTFDATFVTLMRTKLVAYATELRTAYNNTPESSKVERNLLRNQYNQVVLLLKQWPDGK